MEENISIMIISFFIYSIGGWIWESLIFPILAHHKIHNSGFLNGPIVPIYGVGAMTVILIFEQDEKIISLFLEGAVVACIIEYITSWAMEKLYHRRWWDYSEMSFNLNGRICLGGFLIFGLFSVCSVKWIQPMLYNYLIQYNLNLLLITASVLSTLFIVDIAYTVYTMTHIDELLDDISKSLNDFLEDVELNISNRNHLETYLNKMKETNPTQFKYIINNIKYSEKRVIQAFPHLLKERGNKDER